MDENKTILFRALISLKSEEECQQFLNDLLTPDEITQIANRLRVLCLLLSGMKQREVKEITGAAIATVSRANRVLKSGAGGILLVSKKLSKELAVPESQWNERRGEIHVS
jgi:TrpR-related protein YerC/YecD